MFRGRFFGTILALMLIVGLFGLVGSNIYRAGWTQGYFTGKITDAAETGVEVVGPEQATGREVYPGYSPFGSIMGGFFKFFVFFMVIGLSFKMFFGMIFWHKRGKWAKNGKEGHGWQHRRAWGHGHRPPWCDDTYDESYDSSSGKPVMKV